MKILYYDCFTGISGDMNLGALIDLGADINYLNQELLKLKINEEFEIKVSKGIKNGISGTKVDVILKNQHQHHHHDHKEKAHHHHSDHRHYSTIKKMIETSDLTEFVKKHSIDTFEKIAIAEAKIHGTTVDKVHFHEVGATDSIVDVVGNAICIENLNPDIIMSSTIQLGGGFVKCDHGIFPVPAPATMEIVKNTPVKTGLIDQETTTPTGAAVVVTNASKFTDQLAFKTIKIAYGLGTKEFEVPNVLRVYWGETEEKPTSTTCMVCECNIDDMNPEHFTFISDKLFTLGADDVFITPIQMKKGRPASKLSVICKEELIDKINNCILTETTSFGLRYYKCFKSELDRKSEVIVINDIEIRIKWAYYNGEQLKYKPEYDDCANYAKSKGISIAQVYKLVEQKMNSAI